MTIFSKKHENYPILIGIALVLFLLFIAYPVIIQLSYRLAGLTRPNAEMFFTSRLYYWVFLLMMWLYSFNKEKSYFLIWKDQKYKFWVYIVSFIAIYFTLGFGLNLIKNILSFANLYKVSTNFYYIVELLRNNKPLLIFTALTAAVVEELIFRGYLQPRFELIFKNPLVAIIITSFLFGILHYGYGTLINMIGPFFIGVVFSIYYWKFRNIKVLITFHFFWDILVLYMQLRVSH